MDPLTLGGYALALLLGLFSFRMKRGDIWKDEAQAQKARADRLESELTKLTARVDRLESENLRLAELATGHVAIAALSDKVDSNHLQVMTALAAK